MTGDPAQTRPDLPAQTGAGPRMRPRDRRVVQAIALATLLPALLTVHWLDETRDVRSNLKPEEKVTTVPRGAAGELAGARWQVVDRRTTAPLLRPASGAPPGSAEVAEVRVTLAVVAKDAAAAKAVGAYGIVYRLRDGDGRAWAATGLGTGAARPGVPVRITVRGTVPRAKADLLVLEVRPPAYSRPKGPLPSLRFAP
ncbi:hypothetical protein [Actinomadura sp. NEAU-AAG7]|uniref:hypothetical protein n=1 Tax=Actinomadura sp. NEAU-AAG7 TaxID=2839640 RepID=UPI001BE48C8B|nr:hypothetical protein [Actinomadura sp. NEAU-AAG7]MBT2208159.1 hypothetical protein [Actinomadura sp. NEAU-AAG7]